MTPSSPSLPTSWRTPRAGGRRSHGVEGWRRREVRPAAHTLKVERRDVGANELADRSRLLRAAAKAGDLEDGLARLEAIDEELGRVHAAPRAAKV